MQKNRKSHSMIEPRIQHLHYKNHSVQRGKFNNFYLQFALLWQEMISFKELFFEISFIIFRKKNLLVVKNVFQRIICWFCMDTMNEH